MLRWTLVYRDNKIGMQRLQLLRLVKTIYFLGDCCFVFPRGPFNPPRLTRMQNYNNRQGTKTKIWHLVTPEHCFMKTSLVFCYGTFKTRRGAYNARFPRKTFFSPLVVSDETFPGETTQSEAARLKRAHHYRWSFIEFSTTNVANVQIRPEGMFTTPFRRWTFQNTRFARSNVVTRILT